MDGISDVQSGVNTDVYENTGVAAQQDATQDQSITSDGGGSSIQGSNDALSNVASGINTTDVNDGSSVDGNTAEVNGTSSGEQNSVSTTVTASSDGSSSSVGSSSTSGRSENAGGDRNRQITFN